MYEDAREHTMPASGSGAASLRPPRHRIRVCVLIRPSELPGVPAYYAGAFTDRGAAEAVRATLPLVDRARAEIREIDMDDLRP